ncbi:MAG: hypothetical protein QXH07_01330 [Thermoplasmata archaeon]
MGTDKRYLKITATSAAIPGNRHPIDDPLAFNICRVISIDDPFANNIWTYLTESQKRKAIKAAKLHLLLDIVLSKEQVYSIRNAVEYGHI